jgi:(2Fe-2S) ferredoxin
LIQPLSGRREFCSTIARLRDDPMPGTAAPATGFLLIEQPGPWGRRALVQSRLDAAVGAAMGARAVQAGLRALLVRRPGRVSLPFRRRWAVVESRPGRMASWWGEFDADEELLSVPLDGSAGERTDEPAYLVCVHGRHDTCCAMRGRPVAAALGELRPEQVWECSHVGGDRFAANVVALPHGLFYGRVEVEDAKRVVAAHEDGRVLPELLRGRSVYSSVTQAAQLHARRELGVDAVEALEPVASTPLGDDRWEVRLARQPRDVVVTVAARAGAEPALLTCHAVRLARPPRFEVEGLAEVG